MEHTEYKTMSELEESYWWHVGRKHIIRKQLDLLGLDPATACILNIGAGTGDTIPLLSRYGSVTNIEVSDDAIEEARAKGITDMIKVDGIDLPFEENSFDLAVAFDVLEHIDDDFRALREWRRVLKEDGRLMVTVPAHPWLWSAHDESLHHYRRYTVSSLHRLFTIAGYSVLKRSYAIAFSFPLIVGFRFLSSLSGSEKKTSYVKLPGPINWFFGSILRVEGSLLKRVNFPIGTSVLMVGQNDPTHKTYQQTSHTAG